MIDPSFLAVQVIAILEEKYGKTIDIIAFYECETIENLVARIENKESLD